MEIKYQKKVQSLAERDQNAVWHPFTQMKTAGDHIAITKGKGALLYDEDGNEYIDAIASWWMNLHGHAHLYLAEQLYQQAMQLEHVIFANFTHEPAVQLAERVLGKLPANQSKAFYSDNGSTAVEVGLKMCFQYWFNLGEQKTKIIAFEDAYHGDTFGAMSVGGRSAFSEPFAPFLFDVIYLPVPVPGKEEAVLAQLEEQLQAGDVAGFIFEPLVLGAGGMLMYSEEVLEKMIGLCKKYKALSIADEVMIGFGRTGKFFACSNLSVSPDIFCLSKGLTGGTMALGMTTCSEKVYMAFWSDDKLKTLFHGHSCTGNPLACRVGMASMDLMEREETQNNIQHIVQRHQEFAKRLEAFACIENIRQRGVIIAFDVNTGENTSYFNSLRDQIWNFFIERKVILRPLGNTIYVLPPYCIEDQQLDRVYAVIEEFLRGINQ